MAVPSCVKAPSVVQGQEGKWGLKYPKCKYLKKEYAMWTLLKIERTVPLRAFTFSDICAKMFDIQYLDVLLCYYDVQAW